MKTTIQKEMLELIERIVNAKDEMTIIHTEEEDWISVGLKTCEFAMSSYAHAHDMTTDEKNSHFKHVRTVIDFELHDLHIRGNKCSTEVGLGVKIFDKDYLVFDYTCNKDKALDIVKTFLCIQKLG